MAQTEYLTTRELAELLRIKERKVYDLAASGAVPCSKAMGKLLFPRDEIEAWLAAGQMPAPRPPAGRPNVLLGSHDPLLEWALRESQSGLAAYFDGSSDGLQRYQAGEGVAAGLHLFDAITNTWNVQEIATQFGGQPIVLVEWAKRQRGLIVRADHSEQVRKLADIKGLRLAARQAGAGAQQLFVALAQDAGLDSSNIQAELVLRTETDAALAVLENKADVSFGLKSLAVKYRLGFIPIIEERYDLLIDRRAWFEPPLQKLMAFCVSAAFRLHAKTYAGYDVSDLGIVHFNGDA